MAAPPPSTANRERTLMPKIKKFDRDACRTTHEAILAEIKDLAASLGISVAIKAAKYTNGPGMTLTLELAVIDENGMPMDEHSRFFNVCHDQFDLPANALGTTFVANKGKRYRLVGLNPDRYKFPIVCVPVDGGPKVFFTTDVVPRIKIAMAVGRSAS